jgi:hypothetical protein
LTSRRAKRWVSDARDESLLASGLSLGEGLAVAFVVGVLLLVALARYRPALTHTAIVEVFSLSSVARMAWIEQWAVKGGMPVSGGALRSPAPQQTLQSLPGIRQSPASEVSRYVQSVDEAAEDGQIVFQLRGMRRPSSSLIVQFRPAFGPGESPATVLWLCGRAAVPEGFLRVGESRTTLANDELPSSCRGH